MHHGADPLLGIRAVFVSRPLASRAFLPPAPFDIPKSPVNKGTVRTVY